MSAPHAPEPTGEGPLEHVEPPEETLAADEAPTPLWFPLVGLALALVVLVLFIVTRPEPTGDEPTPEAAPSAEAAPEAE